MKKENYEGEKNVNINPKMRQENAQHFQDKRECRINII